MDDTELHCWIFSHVRIIVYWKNTLLIFGCILAYPVITHISTSVNPRFAIRCTIVKRVNPKLSIGLGISDFAMALNFMLSACMNLSGRKIWLDPQKGFCSFNGFITQVFVIQSTTFHFPLFSTGPVELKLC
jgi:hypothetical protein